MQDLARIQKYLAQGELSVAMRKLDDFLIERPDDTDALYLQAVTLRYAKSYQPALRVLHRLKAQSPTHSRVHQEEGHVLRDLGEQEAALQAYARAYALNPALASSLRESIVLLQLLQREDQARLLQVQLDALLALPQPLQTAMDLVAQNKLLKAERVCRDFLRQHPRHIQGMRVLADIATRLGVLDDAEFLLESAAQFAPNNLHVQMDHVQILRKRQKFQAALAHAQRLLDENPSNLQVRSLCAIEHMQTGNFSTAMELLDQILAELPNDARTLVTYGHALKTSGQGTAAVEFYRRAIAAHPLHGESYYSLANLKTYRFEGQEVEQMRVLHDNSNLGFMDRVYLNFALAKALEDREDFDAAFAHYSQGNALKKSHSRYDAQRMHEEFARTRQVCDADFFASREEFGAQACDPIFIVGLPRAGSTLLEQILASHSEVDGTLELPNILSLSQRLRRRPANGADANSTSYPAVLADLSRDECEAFGAAYLEETAIHREGARFYIDKMPNNFRHIGLIKLILPNAKIIDARREPMACCFSGFKQLFAEGQEFSYDLKDIGRYYCDYVELMAHWDSVLPSFVLRVQHEDVVADLDAQVRRMLQFCGLPFEAACVNYHETQRDVRTPSSEQVRQPIFTDSLEQWRHFDASLAPLKQVLGARLVGD